MKIKKITVLAIACFGMVFSSVNAQNMFSKDDKVINLGIGLGSSLHTGTGYAMGMPAISASFELGIKDELFDEKSSLGVGGYLGYASSTYKNNSGIDNEYKWTYSDWIVGVRGALHYQLIENMDTYGGLMLAYDIVGVSTPGGYSGNYSASGSVFRASLYIGGRYYFNDKIAAMGELGYGISVLNIGVSIKL
ncbi:hypothetical protein AwDysgo_15500 [Bacteroidales bacterium]|nr:hypothetical protein AwDysgo_15500 [Bacteroidales bacterium]